MSNINKEIWRDIREGFIHIINDKLILAVIVIFGGMVFFVAPIIIYLKVLAEQYYDMGTFSVSLIMAADGLGVFLATSYLAIKKSFSKSMIILYAFPIFSGLALIIIGNIYNFYLAFIVMFLQGVIAGLGYIKMITLLQKLTPDAKRGKVFGLYSMVNSSLAPLSFGLSGYFIELIGITIILTISGIVLIIGGFALYRVFYVNFKKSSYKYIEFPQK